MSITVYDPVWYPSIALLPYKPTMMTQVWLSSQGSMTRGMEHFTDQPMQVNLKQAAWGRASLQEARRLGYLPNRRCWIREVILMSEGVPWIEARAVFPEPLVKGRMRQIKIWRNKALGKLIFEQLACKRISFYYTAMKDDNGQIRWARQSLFEISKHRFLLTETLLPTMLACIHEQPLLNSLKSVKRS